MQQDADFITAEFLYMFRPSCARHQEYKILTRSFVPNMAKWGSTRNHNYLYRWLPCQYFILLLMGAWRPKHVEKFCSNKICIWLHHVGVLSNLNVSICSSPYTQVLFYLGHVECPISLRNPMYHYEYRHHRLLSFERFEFLCEFWFYGFVEHFCPLCVSDVWPASTAIKKLS